MWYRLNDSSWPLVLVALTRLRAFAESYDWVGTIDWDKGTAIVHETIMAGNAYMVDGYLVLTEVVCPWYTKDKLLQEWLVLKVESGGKVASIPPALETIAAANNCVAVISADSSPVQLVAAAYKEAGYKALTNSFYKVVSNGIHSTSCG